MLHTCLAVFIYLLLTAPDIALAGRRSSMLTCVRIVTLNCWSLPQPWPIGSRDRKYRIDELIKALLAEKYDVVALQELWSESDFDRITRALGTVMPYAHYFHSGFTGSGVSVFSRFPIVSTLMHRYSLNGFAHHVHRGDWFGGKVVGMVELQVEHHRLNFYTTHLHAQYNEANDLYLPHRLAQAFELSQFIKHTSRGADFVVLTGDFNIEPEDLGYRLIVTNTKLIDAWATRPNARLDDSGMTCDRPDNTYTLPSLLRNADNAGKRLDYVLYKSGRMNVELMECDICLNRIPGTESKNYSDHVGVYARFRIREDERNVSEDWIANEPLLDETITILKQGEHRAIRDRRLFMGICLVLTAILLASLNLDAYFPALTILISIGRFVVTLIIGFSMWYGFLGLTMELKALKAAKSSVAALLNDWASPSIG